MSNSNNNQYIEQRYSDKAITIVDGRAFNGCFNILELGK